MKLIIDLKFKSVVDAHAKKNIADSIVDNLQHFINIDDHLFKDEGFSDSMVEVLSHKIEE